MLIRGLLLPCALLLTTTLHLQAQSAICNLPSHMQLKLLQERPGIPQYFATLYLRTDSMLDNRLQKATPPEVEFVEKLAAAFHERYLDACDKYQQHQPVPAAWQPYFSDTLLPAEACWLSGAIIHIRTDLPQVLYDEFSLADLRQFKTRYYQLQPGFDLLTSQAFAAAQNNPEAFQHIPVRKEKYWHHLLHRWRRQAYRTALKAKRHGRLPEEKLLRRSSHLVEKLQVHFMQTHS